MAAALAVLAWLPPSPPAAADPATLALRYAGPWPALQAPDGRFAEYLSTSGRGRYGEAVLGHALLTSGLQAGDERLVDAGLRAIGYAIVHPEVQEAFPSVFETYALAAAYKTLNLPMLTAEVPRSAMGIVMPSGAS